MISSVLNKILTELVVCDCFNKIYHFLSTLSLRDRLKTDLSLSSQGEKIGEIGTTVSRQKYICHTGSCFRGEVCGNEVCCTPNNSRVQIR